MSYLKNEQGIALPIVLLSMIVLSVLGLTLLGIAANQATRTVQHEKKVQAHYIARSGADAIAAHIIDNFDNVTLTASKIADINAITNTTSTTIGDGEVKVEVQRNADQVEIKSVGTVGNVSDTVTLTLDLNSGFTLDHAILSLSDIKLDGNIEARDGNIAAVGSFDITDGTIEVGPGQNKTENYKGPLPPELPFFDSTGMTVKSLTNEYTITETSYFGTMATTVGKYFINMNSEEDIHIVFDDYYVDGNQEIVVNGDPNKGVVWIYINDFNLTGTFTLHNVNNVKVVLYIKGQINSSSSMKLTNVLLYGPNTNFTGALDMSGAMITNGIDSFGNVIVKYEPDLVSNIIFKDKRFKRVMWSG